MLNSRTCLPVMREAYCIFFLPALLRVLDYGGDCSGDLSGEGKLFQRNFN